MSNRAVQVKLAGIALSVGVAIASFPSCVLAQTNLNLDGTLGTQVAPVNSQVDMITGGTQRGGNLFHSFSEFNVGAGRGVYFQNPTGVMNILSRVTGGNPSQILGTLGVLGNANLFLLNPNGIIFGENARLDVNGSFTASTAKSFIFDNGTEFSATNPQAPPLLTVNVRPGLQYGSNGGGNITNRGNLSVGAGQSLTLQGKGVSNYSAIVAPGGRVELLGDRVGLFEQARIDVSSPGGGGTVLIGGSGHGSTDTRRFPNAQRTFVGKDVTINASARGNGDGGRVIVWSDESTRFYGTINARGGDNSGNGGFVEVSGKQSLDFNGLVDAGAKNGVTGSLLLDPTNIRVVGFGGETSNLSDVDAFSDPDIGTVGDTRINAVAINNATANVTLQATENITFDAAVNMRNPDVGLTAEAGNNIFVNNTITTNQGGINLIAGRGGIGINSDIQSRGGDIFLKAGSDINVNRGVRVGTETPRGNSGDLRIETAGRLILQDSQVSAATSGSGNAGNVTVIASEIQLNPSEGFARFGTLITASSEPDATGNAGKITIQTGRLTIRNGAQVIVGTFGAGNAGEIDVKAGEIQVIGDAQGSPTSSLVADSLPGSTGNSGKIKIETGRLLLRDGGNVSVATFNANNAGELVIRATEIDMSGIGNEYPSALFASTFPGGTGGGGRVDIVTGSLLVQNGAIIETKAPIGNGGNLNITATESVKVVGNSLVDASSLTGRGGNISLNTRNLTVDEGSEVRTGSFGQGNAGNITVRSSESVTVGKRSAIGTISFGSGDGGGIDIETGILTIRDSGGVTTGTAGTGNAGTLRIAADTVNVISGGNLTTQTLGTGTGGNLTIETRNLNVLDVGKIFTSSLDLNSFDFNNFSNLDPNLYPPEAFAILRAFVNEAAQSNAIQGNSGNLTIRARETVNVANTGIISTQARGRATGGNLSLDAQNLNLQNLGLISTDTFGAGNAGDLKIRATDSLLVNDVSVISSTALPGSSGNGGKLTIETGRATIQNNSAIASATGGTGRGGNINFQANSLALINTGRLTSRSDGTGNAGNLSVNLNNNLQSNGGLVEATSIRAGGGNVNITAEDILLRNSSLVATSVFDSTGGGGNINIQGRTFVAVEDSDILANAEAGPGGDITINSPAFLAQLFDGRQAEAVGRNPGAFQRFRGNGRVDISAESRTGTSGTVDLPNIDESIGLPELPSDLTDATRQIDQRCSPGSPIATGQSSFTITGTGGVPPSPTDMLRNNVILDNEATAATDAATDASLTDEADGLSVRERDNLSVSSVTESVATVATIIEAQGWIIDKNGDIILTAEPTTLAPPLPGAIAPPCTLSSINK